MATETNPENHGASPVHGNFTTDASTHIWCADALARLVATPDASLGEFQDDIQDAIRYLLACEISRAKKAAEAESHNRIDRAKEA